MPETYLPFATPDIGEQEIEAVVSTMRSGWLTTGPGVISFEREFADFVHDRSWCAASQMPPDLHAVAVNSATAGLHLAIESLHLAPGDEVLIPTWTFTATAEVVRYVGAKPVLVDVDPRTLNLDLEAARAQVSERTRAVMPVHFAGLPVDRVALESFAAEFDLAVIEDAAHAFPVLNRGSLVGAGPSTATVFSFYATKTMTTGEGGMIITPDPDLASRMRSMRLHGIDRDVFGRYQTCRGGWQYDVVAPGFKYNMTDIAAAIGRVQLQRSCEMWSRRAMIAEHYDREFRDLPVELPARPRTDDTGHAWHLYVLKLDQDALVTRDEFIQEMSQLGVGCSVHFIPLHRHSYWRETGQLTDAMFPAASHAAQTTVSLPIFSSMSLDQVDRVVTCVRKILS